MRLKIIFVLLLIFGTQCSFDCDHIMANWLIHPEDLPV